MIDGGQVEIRSFKSAGKLEYSGQVLVNRESRFTLDPNAAPSDEEDCRVMAAALVVRRFWDEVYGDIGKGLAEIMEAAAFPDGDVTMQAALNAVSVMSEKARDLHYKIYGGESPHRKAEEHIAQLMLDIGIKPEEEKG